MRDGYTPLLDGEREREGEGQEERDVGMVKGTGEEAV